jgi:multimeric flavodoxin WrbA
MKCLIINGSPHKGNTWTLVEIIKSHMAKQGDVTFEEVHLYKLNIPMCLGCNVCFFKGEQKCPHSEYIQPIAEKIANSDCLIITSPSYSLGISATCKNFIDHMSYNFHRPRFSPKKFLVLSTTSGAGSKDITKYIRNVLKFWGFNHGYKLAVSCFSTSGYQPTAKVVKQCETVAEQFYKDVASKKIYSASIKRVLYYNLWRAMSNMGTVDENMDYRYWLETGMRDTTYHKEVKIGIFKKALGNLLYNMLKKSMVK